MKFGLVIATCCITGCERPQPAGSEPRLDPADGERLITEYLARDLQGERLRASEWFPERVSWTEEPGWDESTVVESYDIERIASDSQTVSCRVIHRALGLVSATDTLFVTFREAPKIDTVIFEAKTTTLGWRITRPRYNPHVGVTATIADSSLEESSRRRLQEMLRSAVRHDSSIVTRTGCGAA